MAPVLPVVIHGTGPVTFPEYLSWFGRHVVGVIGLGLLVYWLVAVIRRRGSPTTS